MDTVFVTMLTTVGENQEGETYEIDSATADKWVAAGLCEVVEAPTDKLFDKFEKAIADRDNKIVEELSKSLRNVNVKVPAVARHDDDNPENNFFVLVGKTASKDSRVREKAYNTLANKYGKKDVVTSNETTTTAGGFLVPTEQAKELLRVEGYEGAAYPSRINVRPMQGKVLNLPALDQTVTPANGSSAFYGGVSIGVVAEGSAPAANTAPAFKQVVLTAQKVLATAQVTSELLSDSPLSVQSIISDGFKNAAVQWVDWNIFNGSGSDELTGIIDHAATIKIARATASDITLADLAKMYSRLTPGSTKNAAWFINPLAMAKFPLLGNSNHLVWLPDGVNGKPVLTFLGLPIVACESLPSVGTAGDVVLADLRYYAFGLNTDVTVDASEHVGFTSDLVTYRMKFRVDGKPQLTAPIYLQNASDTVSPFVQLDDRAS